MSVSAIYNRFAKVLWALSSMELAHPLLRYRVLAASEHRKIINPELKTCVDIGANRGQFSLALRRWAPQANVIAFEPLPVPARIYQKVFTKDACVELHQYAIGPEEGDYSMHVSFRDDSSSLLPISDLQSSIFPGTFERSTVFVKVAPLENFLTPRDIRSPSLLKLDVQGFEYDALLGCEPLLSSFEQVYCECSFVELYTGQKLAGDVILWLASRGFHVAGIYNPSYDSYGQTVQADFLFCRI